MTNEKTNETHAGIAAIVGRPNVGKSTLLNRLLGQKISITSRKPQTTRHRILGIHTENNIQTVYVDTPGFHQSQGKPMSRYLNRVAIGAMDDVNVILFLVEAGQWYDEDEMLAEKIKSFEKPVILVINKVDKLKNPEELFAFTQKVSEKIANDAIIPVSAKTGERVPALQKLVSAYLPVAPYLFSEDDITDRSNSFLASEIIREKLMRSLGDELPYELTVVIEKFEATETLNKIYATILVEKDSQKPIVIGARGELLKKVGTEARLDMETLFQRKVFLQLWVKVKSGWGDDEASLRSLGYGDDK